VSNSLSLFWIRSGHGSASYDINEGEELEVTVYTRSPAGAKFTVTDANKSHTPWVENFEVKHEGSGDMEEGASHECITKEKIQGPASVKVKADSNGGRWSSHNMLVVFGVFSK
jgi:hypothetical protein